MLRRLSNWLIILSALAFVSKCAGQKSTAPNGYYPAGFSGAVFTGRLESIRADAEELTLIFTNGNKTEQFVGKLESTCGWKEKSGASHVVRVSDLPKGMVLTAFYISKTNNSGGVKTNENLIFALSQAEQNGKKIPDDSRIVISCSKQQRVYFMAFQ